MLKANLFNAANPFTWVSVNKKTPRKGKKK